MEQEGIDLNDIKLPLDAKEIKSLMEIPDLGIWDDVKYNEAFHPKAAIKILSKGCSEVGVAAHFMISIKKLREWKSFYPEFREAIEIGLTASQAFLENIALNNMVEFKDSPVINTKLWEYLVKSRTEQLSFASPIQIDLITPEMEIAKRVFDLVKKFENEGL